MPVSDFECQIARGQIGRYLDGGALSSQALAGLEAHLAECPDCKATVADRRAALLGKLGGAVSTRAVVSMPVENPLIAALRAKAEETAEETLKPEPKTKATPRYAKEPSKKGNLGKPLALAALLAVVLLGMSRVSKTVSSPTAKADVAFAADALPTEAAKPAPVVAVFEPEKFAPVVPKPAPKAAASIPEPSDSRETRPTPAKTIAPKPVKPKPLVVAKPKAAPVVRKAVRVTHPRKAAVRRLSKLVRKRPHSPRKVSRTTVRVYGLDGRPLKP